jgi:multidrug efflux system membrane fusion protein
MSKVSIGVAFFVVIMAVVWFGLGLRDDEFDEAKAAQIEENKKSLGGGERDSVFSVKWEDVVSELHRESLSFTGRTRATRRTELKVEQAGKVKKVYFDVWDEVDRGDLLAELEEKDLPSRLRRAETDVRVKKGEYEAEQRLLEKGVSGEIKVLRAELAFRSAEEALALLRVKEKNLRVKAPFSGTVTRRYVEEGTVLGNSGNVARLLKLSPLVVDIYLTDEERRRLDLVEEVEVDFGEGLVRSGRIEEKATEVEEGTRTYRVSLAVDNKDGELVEGMKGRVVMKMKGVPMHRLESSWLLLGVDDELGVMVVDGEGEGEGLRAKFVQVELLSDDQDGVWVSGLEDKVRVVTLGNYYLQDGDRISGEV